MTIPAPAINTINAATPFLIGVANSQVNPPWIRFFNQVAEAVGSPQSIVADEFQTLVFTSRSFQQTNDQMLQQQLRTAKNLLGNATSALIAMAKRLEVLEAALYGRDTAAAADKAFVFEDNTKNTDMYPTFSINAGGYNTLRFSSAGLKFNPSTGRMTSTQLVATTGFGCNGKAPQTAFTVGAAAPAGGAGTAAGGYDTAVNRDAMIALVNNMRTALINNGIAVL